MKIAVCDDIKEYRLSLKAYINDYFARKHMNYELFEFSTGNSLIDSNNSFDVVFLDIELGDSNGIDVAKAIQGKSRNTIILIVTSYNQYLDAAMDIKVIRYINKPISQEKIFAALDRAIAELNEKYISVHLKNNQITRIKVSDVVYVEAKLKKVTICTINNEYITRDSLKSLSYHLNASCFAVPHNSYIVNLNYIKDFKRDEITLNTQYGPIKISVASRKQSLFRRRFLDFIGEGINE